MKCNEHNLEYEWSKENHRYECQKGCVALDMY